MIRTNLIGQECFIVTQEPDWNSPVQGDFKMLTSTNESSTRRQERQAFSNSIRSTLRWKSYQDYNSAPAFRSALHSLGLTFAGANAPLQPILCPFWPGMSPFGQGSNYSAFYSIIWEPGFTAWAIFETALGFGAFSSGFSMGFGGGGSFSNGFSAGFSGANSYTPTPQSMVAPLLVGVFDKLPKVTAHTDEDAYIDFSFMENGAAQYALQVNGLINYGPGWQGVPTWPILIDVPQNSSVEAGGVDISIARKQIGYTRDMAQTVYPQTPNRTIKSNFVMGDASPLLALWQASLADVNPFWVPAAFSPCRLTADLTVGNVINVDNLAALDGQAHLFMYGSTWTAQRIISEGTSTITLASAPGQFPAAATYIQPLLFAHFVGPMISVSWTDPNLSTCTLQFEELPPEYGSPVGETFSLSIGPMGVKTFLYTFTDGIGTWRYTSNEQSIVYQGNTYVSQHITHATIQERVNLDVSTTDVTMRYFTPNPFTRYRTPRLQMAMFVTVQSLTTAAAQYLVDQTGAYIVDGAGRYIVGAPPAAVAYVELTGRLRVAKYDNSEIVIQMGGPTTLFDQMLPRPLVQIPCNATLFDSKCGLLRANWTFAATMPVPPAPGAPFQYSVQALSWPQGALPALPAHYFAFGHITRTLPDGTQQGAIILDSTAIAAGVVVLTLNGDLSPFPTGSEAWGIVPACAGRYNEDCIAKFNNAPNFRGFPFMPLTDPSILPNTTTTPRSSKK